MHKLLFVLAALAGTSAMAGMYDQPYAIVEMGDSSDIRKEAMLGITKVDGRNARNPRMTDPLPPGKHVISLHFSSARVTFRPEAQDIEIDLEACMRYRVVASYEIKAGPNWKPKVYSEPIGECRKKFAPKGAAAK